MSKEIDKAYDYWKEKLHGMTWNTGLELHHVYGRVGIFKCCPIFMAMLTKEEHNSWKVIKRLREDKRELKLIIEKRYKKGEGCFSKRISIQCFMCPMYKERT